MQDNQSCRGCVLTGCELPLMVDPLSTLSNMAWAGNFSGADLLDATLFAIDRSTGGSPTNEPLSLIGWDFSGANLSNVTGLKGANLSGANLSGANLTNTSLQGATLAGTNLSGATLINSTLPATLSATNLSGVTGLQGANLSGITLSNANLSGTNLQGATLTGAVLDQVITNGTVFDGADLRGAASVGLQFEVAPSFNGVTVGAFNGTCTTFQDVNLSSANLTLVGITAGCENQPASAGQHRTARPMDFVFYVA